MERDEKLLELAKPLKLAEVNENRHTERPGDPPQRGAQLIHACQEMHWAILGLGSQLFWARIGGMQKELPPLFF